MDNLTLSGTIEYKLSQGAVSSVEITDFIVTHFYADLHRLALSMLHDYAEADDVAQQAVINAVRKMDRYRPGSNLKGWLFKITVNLCRDLMRKKRAKERLQNLLKFKFSTERPHQKPANPELELIHSEQDRQLWAAVNQLKEKHKLLILLRYSFELPHAEIGEIMGIPEGTVRSRLFHAHKQLHGLLVAQGVTSR